MVSEAILEAAKTRIRKTNSDNLDNDVRQLAEVAIEDLKRIGVSDNFLSDCSNALIKEAILVYVKANYGDNPDREKLMESYKMILTKIKGGKFKNDV